MWAVLSERGECGLMNHWCFSIAAGFNRRRLPHQEIRAGATDGGKHRGRLKGETAVSHFVMCMCVRGCVEGWGEGKGREKELVLPVVPLPQVYHCPQILPCSFWSSGSVQWCRTDHRQRQHNHGKCILTDINFERDYQFLCRFARKQYVNRSFLDLSGYTRDEVIGKPAMDILKTFDSKTVSSICHLNLKNVYVVHDFGCTPV